VSGPAVWVRVEGKGSFLNSGNLKEFAQEMVNRGYREFVIDLEHCAMMDSTFMGTMAGVSGAGVEPPAESKKDQAQTILEAHEALCQAAPENFLRFKDVLDYLKQDLHHETTAK